MPTKRELQERIEELESTLTGIYEQADGALPVEDEDEEELEEDDFD